MATDSVIKPGSTTAQGRCQACGQPIPSDTASRCPLCGFSVGDEPSAAVDVTPYAQCLSQRRRGWYRMCQWIWFAGAGRLKHLAMLHASYSSRRFARINLLLLTAALAVFQAATLSVGWHAGHRLSPTLPPTAPTGYGWVQVADTPKAMLPRLAVEADVALWWNPLQTSIVFVASFATAWLMLTLSMSLVRAGLMATQRDEDRDAKRMTAAIHYGTAWAAPIAVGFGATLFSPLARIGAASHGSWVLPQPLIHITVAVIAALGAAMWWFWMLRLGFCAAPVARTRVAAFCTLGIPLFVGLGAAAWWFGLRMLYDPLFKLNGLA